MDEDGKGKKGDFGFGLVLFFTVATIIYVAIWTTGAFDHEKWWVGPFGTLLFGGFAIFSWKEYIKTLSEKWKNRIRIVLLPVSLGVFGLWGLFGILMVILPIGQQIVYWLRYGDIIPRDLFWLFAPPSCAATNWQARGWEGKDICRSETLYQTGWIGADKIISFSLDLHVTLIYMIASISLWFIVISFADALNE